ncbi:hypothetical protein CL176_00590 [Suicoccus acidiformans]|uniref:Uncharacterized protein n=1 Tax=Suicoccus acidiformans TaxID=2036206 RepID=A0A347WNM6_9LACT|nr:hypothetical protein CL176_00590 [Suicoccus acidiformans]
MKIVIASVLAILIAQVLSLENTISARIIALLSVLDTRTATLKTAGARISLTILVFVVATTVFHFLGFSP